jgi:adenylyltransferase/sulfurtransferase
MNPEVEVIALAARLEGEALRDAVARATVVLDCCDNFATRHAVNRACVEAGVPLVSGAAIRFDGQLAVFDTRRADSPCYHCLFPDGQDVEAVRCATMGVFAPLTGIVGTMQAAEALKLAGGFGAPMTGQLLLIDTRTMSIDRIRVPRDPGCPVCGHRPHA